MKLIWFLPSLIIVVLWIDSHFAASVTEIDPGFGTVYLLNWAGAGIIASDALPAGWGIEFDRYQPNSFAIATPELPSQSLKGTLTGRFKLGTMSDDKDIKLLILPHWFILIFVTGGIFFYLRHHARKAE